jgi:hypothetical protein
VDFDGWTNSLGQQFAVIAEAPAPFAVAVLLLGFGMWRAFQWRYDAIIERQREHITHLERRPNLTPQSVTLPVKSGAKQKSSPSAAASSEPKERIFVPDLITPVALAKLIRGQNPLQAEKLTAAYVGKWIKVTAQVFSIDVTGSEIYLGLMPNLGDTSAAFRGEGVTAFFPKSAEGLEILSRGDDITLIGKIAKVDSAGLLVTHCELVR